MKNVYFKGGDMFMGNGLICREPGVYETTDEFAEFLLENHSDQFEAANEDHDEDDSQSSADSESGDTGEQQESSENDGVNVDPEVGAGHDATHAKDVEHSSDDKSVAPTDEGLRTVSEVEDAGASDGPEGRQEETETSTPSKSLSKMNKTELEAVADEIGAKVNPTEMTADQMREAIKSQQAS